MVDEEKPSGDTLRNYKFFATKIAVDTSDIDLARAKVAQLLDDLQKLSDLWDSVLSKISCTDNR